MKAAGLTYRNLTYRNLAYCNQDYWLAIHSRERGRHAAVGYAQMGDAFNRVAYRIRKAAVRRILDRHMVYAASLLEAGVGIGAYGELWQALGVRQWTGVDISPDAVETVARRYPQHRFLQLDLTRDRIGDEGRFGLVTAIDVLYHLVEDGGFEHAIQTLAGAVRSGSHLLVSDVFCAETRQINIHVKRRPMERYQELLAAQGLRLVDREPVYAILGDPVPRPGSWRDAILYQTWRAAAKAIRSCPSGWAREAVGGAAAAALSPIDCLLRKSGITRGVNLELALFERAGAGLP